MYEFHGWVALAESPSEIDEGAMDPALEKIRAHIASLKFGFTHVQLLLHNGRHTLTVDGYPNRRRSESDSLRQLLEYVAELLPGSYGVIYEGDEGVPLPGGRGVFTVTTIRRGRLHSTLDPFLSPVIPVIEDG